MINKFKTKQFRKIFLGDSLALLAVTYYGFATHYKSSFDMNRFFASFIPWLVIWLIVAFLLKLYDEKIVLEISSIWRILIAVVITAPIATLVRGFWLSGGGRAIVPLFIAIMGAFSALALIIWRFIYRFMRIRKQ